MNEIITMGAFAQDKLKYNKVMILPSKLQEVLYTHDQPYKSVQVHDKKGDCFVCDTVEKMLEKV